MIEKKLWLFHASALILFKLACSERSFKQKGSFWISYNSSDDSLDNIELGNIGKNISHVSIFSHESDTSSDNSITEIDFCIQKLEEILSK